MNLKDLDKLLRPYRNALRNMVSRAVLTLVDDSTKMQLLQVGLLADETRDEVERVQNYGFTSVPESGAEAVVLFVNGRRDHPLAIAVEDRRYRIRNLASGEVCVYDKSGSTITMKANGDIEIVPSSGTVSLTGDLVVSGAMEAGGDIDSGGTVTAATEVTAGAINLTTHLHAAGALLSAAPGQPVTGSTATPT